MINKLKNFGRPLCPNCDTILVTYRPKKSRLKTLVQFRYQCSNCHQAFLLPSWVIWVFFVLFTLFYFSVKSPLGVAFFLILFEPMIALAKADKMSINGFVWSVGIMVIVLSFSTVYLVVKFGSRFVRNQLLEIPLSELKDWKAFRRDTRKEIINDLKAIKKSPLWQKIMAIIFTLAVVGLVLWSVNIQ